MHGLGVDDAQRRLGPKGDTVAVTWHVVGREGRVLPVGRGRDQPDDRRAVAARSRTAPGEWSICVCVAKIHLTGPGAAAMTASKWAGSSGPGSITAQVLSAPATKYVLVPGPVMTLPLLAVTRQTRSDSFTAWPGSSA
jgi:hypothetical protein